MSFLSASQVNIYQGESKVGYSLLNFYKEKKAELLWAPKLTYIKVNPKSVILWLFLQRKLIQISFCGHPQLAYIQVKPK